MLIFCASKVGSSDLSAQNALDLLLNMSNARELAGNALQVTLHLLKKEKVYLP